MPTLPGARALTDRQPENETTTDLGFRLIVCLVFVVVVWLLAIPLASPVAEIAMKRFHLSSDSFFEFALQQPVPSMYNFANRYEVKDSPDGQALNKGYINHFPIRVLTWAYWRHEYLSGGRACYVTLESSYRGRKLRSQWSATPNEQGGFELVRESVR